MLLKYFYDRNLAQASYLIACQAMGVAVVIDPARNIQPYLQAAEEEGVAIEFVAETHIHADYLSGSLELASATGAIICLSDVGGEDWRYEFPDPNIQLLKDGDCFKVGNVEIHTLHTPGHTPEHISFQITDTANADKPIAICTGDALFVGDVGRPDLLEEAAGMAGTAQVGAYQQFQTVQRFKAMPDYLQILPGHGAGSACGKALGSLPSTTLGYEKLFNPAFQFQDQEAFSEWLLDGQPEPPRYFTQMKKLNRIGPKLLAEAPTPHQLEIEQLEEFLTNGDFVIDTRHSIDFARGHVPGTINIPANSNSFATYVGWYVEYAKPTYFICYPGSSESVITALHAIGVDYIPGFFTPDAIHELASSTVTQMTSREVYDALLPIVDVRGGSEYQDKHIPGTKNIPMGYILDYVEELDRESPLVLQCGGGVRSQIVASLLQREGFTNVINLEGGIDAWQKVGLPLEEA